MVVGILDHQTGTRDIRLLPPASAAAGGPSRSSRSSARRRWPASRSLLGSSPRRRPTTRSSTARSSAADLVLGGVVAGSVLTVAYSARFVWGAFVVPRPCRGPKRRRPPTVARVTVAPPSWPSSRRPPCSPRSASSLGVVPGVARPARRRRGRRRSTPTPTRCTWRSGTGSTSPSCCPRSRCRRRRACSSSADRLAPSCSRVGAAIPSGTEVYLGVAARPQRGRRPGHGDRPERLAADLRRRHPADRRAAARRRCSPTATGRAGRRWSASPADVPSSPCCSVAAARRRRRPPPLRRPPCSSASPGYAHGGAVRGPGRTRPRLTQVGDRDAVDRAVRARAAPPARPLRARSRRRRRRGRCASSSRSRSGVMVFVVRARRRASTGQQPPVVRRRWSSGRCPTATAATSST